MQAVKNSPPNKKASSIICFRVQSSRGFSLHSSTKGVTTTAPTASPSHQVHQIGPYIVHSANPLNARLVTPIVALTAVLTIPARKPNLKTSCALSKECGPPAKRVTRYQPTTPSRVFPTAMPIEVATDPAVATLTRNAPVRIADQTRYPRIRKAARSIPLHG